MSMVKTQDEISRDRRLASIEYQRLFLALQEETLDEVGGSWSPGRKSNDAFYHPPFGDPKADVARWIRAMKQRGAKIDKVYPSDSDSWSAVKINATFPEDRPLGTVTALVTREAVCERVEVGTREVTETIPDPAIVKAAPLVEVTHTVTDYRWECSPMLAEDAA